MLLKKLTLALLLSTALVGSAFAGTADITVTNSSSSDSIVLTENGMAYMSFVPAPSASIAASGSDSFDATSTINGVESVKLVYAAPDVLGTGKCTFEYAATKNFLTGLWSVLWIKATRDYNILTERMFCTSSLTSFSIYTGTATMTFDARYYKL